MYAFVLSKANSKKNTTYQVLNERISPNLDKKCYSASLHTRGQRRKNGIALENIIGLLEYYSLQNRCPKRANHTILDLKKLHLFFDALVSFRRKISPREFAKKRQ